MFDNHPEFCWLFDSVGNIDVCEELAQRIIDLETAIVEVESENEELARNFVVAEQQRLSEEALWHPSSSNQKPTKSLDFDDYLDPENIRLMEEQQQQRATDPAMAARLRYIEATIPANAGEHTVQGLLETWDLNNKN